jgi:hypothetical protein
VRVAVTFLIRSCSSRLFLSPSFFREISAGTSHGVTRIFTF